MPSGLYPSIWPFVLWLMVWSGLNAGPDKLFEYSNPLGMLHSARALFPLAAGCAALVLWLRNRPRLWSPTTPLGLLTYSGIMGMVASLAVSPEPLIGCYWALCYLAVLGILRLDFFNTATPDRLRTLVRLNWILVACVAVLLTWIYWGIMATKNLVSFYSVHRWQPFVAGMPMALPSGLARDAAILGLVALSRLLHAGRDVRRVAGWGGVLVLTTGILYLCESRVATCGFLIASVLVLLAARRIKLIVAGVVMASVVVFGMREQLWLSLERYLQVDQAGGILGGRVEIWGALVQLWSDSPLLGFGFHTERLLLQEPYQAHPSNAFLHILFQGGLPAATAFVAAWVLIWRSLGCALRSAGNRGIHEYVFLGEVTGVLAFLFIRSFFESTGAFYGIDWLLLAPLVASIQAMARQPVAPRQQVFSPQLEEAQVSL